MKSRADYEKALAVVGSVIREWDPYCLLAHGAPLDEFDAEIAKVVMHIPRIRSPQDAASALSTVFSHAFEADLFLPEACAAQGEALYDSLSKAGLLHA